VSLYGIHRLVFLAEALCSMLVLAFIRPRFSLQLEGGGGTYRIPEFVVGYFRLDCVLLTDGSVLDPRFETWE